MNFRRLLLPLLILLMLASCDNNSSAFYLEGGSEAEVFIALGDVLARITIPSGLLESYSEYSGLEGEEAINSLFGVPAASYTVVDDDSYNRRLEVMRILLEETGSSSIASMLSSFAGDLRKTSFDNTMNELSEGYDTKGLLAAAERSGRQYEYALDALLPQTAPWEEKERFIRLWSRQILRID